MALMAPMVSPPVQEQGPEFEEAPVGEGPRLGYTTDGAGTVVLPVPRAVVHFYRTRDNEAALVAVERRRVAVRLARTLDAAHQRRSFPPAPAARPYSPEGSDTLQMKVALRLGRYIHRVCAAHTPWTTAPPTFDHSNESPLTVSREGLAGYLTRY